MNKYFKILLFVSLAFNAENVISVAEKNESLKRVFIVFPPECLPEHSAIEDFPEDLFSQNQRRSGYIAFHFLGCFYIFLQLSVICEFYFIPSLKHISLILNLSSDVSGATLMAIGSSAPTLFIAIISVFIADSAADIGLGTIVGSTIFNTLFIISASALSVPKKTIIAWYPIMRDTIAYLISTSTLVATVSDKSVHWWEAIIFIFIYSLYILVMFYNKKIEVLATKLHNLLFSHKNGSKVKDNGASENSSNVIQNQDSSKISKGIGYESCNNFEDKNSVENYSNMVECTENVDCGLQDKNSGEKSYIKMENELDIGDSKNNDLHQMDIFNRPKGLYLNVLWLGGILVICLYSILAPLQLKQRFAGIYNVWIFILSTAFLGFLSYILVWMVCVIGYTYDIPDCVLGMTFLAAGSSLPDVIASIIVAKEGKVDMSIANAVGSNVFDMLCLGLPWFIKSAIIHPGSSIEIQSQSTYVSGGLLIGTMIYAILALYLNRWLLDRRIGILFLFTYLAVICKQIT